eukprot:CAMPEP_0206472526 /NCGR_PEP_ID=MMETSP0324_2-20121206/32255_1 /ASSEMBLY_ACC=CAM_ASM_000836 /TAXON_ID=2866 /ORGANISM="Crypthecodinium cohnii, Strain Seligo" /LENGTH=32 /DNA_ID= /DNA_START= /DNA_END= /DNA_ORIENTATION=
MEGVGEASPAPLAAASAAWASLMLSARKTWFH